MRPKPRRLTLALAHPLEIVFSPVPDQPPRKLLFAQEGVYLKYRGYCNYFVQWERLRRFLEDDPSVTRA